MRWGLIGRTLVLSSIVLTALLLAGSAIATPNPTASPAPAESITLLGAMNAHSGGESLLLHQDGETGWAYRDDVNAVADVSMLAHNRYLLSYIRKPANQTDEEMLTGARIVNPSTNETVWQYEFEVPYLLNHEVHDAEVLPSGDVVIADMGRERVFVVDRETKEIAWAWNASSHYQPPEEVRQTDWLHINDVDHIGDGRFLVSVRNANQLLVIERGTGVVEVVNEDTDPSNDENCRGPQGWQMVGDNPRCGDPGLLNHQHNPQWLGGGHILVADSENDRVVELKRTNGSWEIAWAIYRANGVRLDWPRDADRLPNGHTLITDTRNARLVEVDQSGNVVWAASAPPNVYEADRGEEYPAGPTFDSGGQKPGIDQPIHLVGLLHGGVQHSVGLPAWLGEWTFLGLLAGIVGAWVGMAVWLIGPRASVAARVVRERNSDFAEALKDD